MPKNENIISAVNRALSYALENDKDVFLMGEDIADEEGGGVLKVTHGLSSKYGADRVLSTPISEMAFTGAGVGAAIAGMKPVVEIMLMNFTAVCMDQITNHAAKIRYMSGGQTNVPMVIRTMTGSGFQTGGQHSDFLEAWFCHTPGLKVVMPSNAKDAYGLLLSAINDPDPVIYIEHSASYWNEGEAAEDGELIPIGKANIVREGSDITLIGYSRSMMELSMVASSFEEKGISCEVIDLRTVSPIDYDTILKSVEKTGRALIAHEAVKSFGVGAEVSATIQERAFKYLKAPVARVASKDTPVPFAKNLESEFTYALSDIENAVLSCMNYAESDK